MKKPNWCEKHFKIRRVVSELQNSSSHFNRTALYTIHIFRKDQLTWKLESHLYFDLNNVNI